MFGEQKLAALLFLKPDFNSSLTGSFSFSKINNQFDFIGELDLDIENFSGNAEQLKFFWKKNKNISQKIKLRTFYPHVLGSEIGAFWNMILKIIMLFIQKEKKR